MVDSLLGAHPQGLRTILGRALCAALLVTSAASAQATLVKDINTGFNNAASASNPTAARDGDTIDESRFAQVGPITYFVAKTQGAGTELWSSLGTAASTKIVADLWPGPGSSSPGSLCVVGSLLFFAAEDPTNGRELRVFDGTSVKLVADIVAGAEGSNPGALAAFGSKLLFAADDGKNGEELWVSDGTATGTVMLKDLYPGTTTQYGVQVPNAGSPSSITADPSGTKAWFQADKGNGRELWLTDGTAAGTVQVADLNTTTASNSSPSAFRFVNGKVLFQANDGVNGIELWTSDGTQAGTVLLVDIRAGSGSGTSLSHSIVHNGLLYFQGNDATAGAEAWVSDGTAAGTKLLVDALAGTGAGQFLYPVVHGGKVVFGARTSSSAFGLWSSDGTASGTTSFATVGTGTPQWLQSSTKGLFFTANGGSGYELWLSDGTQAGTAEVMDINTTTATASSSPQYIVQAIPGLAVFAADDGLTGRELWVSDGTKAGTLNLDLNQPAPSPTLASSPNYLCALDDVLLFSALEPSAGRELWRSDGTTAGTTLVLDIYGGTSSGNPLYLVRLGSKVLFQANDGKSGAELWVTDGTAAGTKLLADINAGTASSSPSYLTRVRDKVYFMANDGKSGQELWVTDGTAAGTAQVADINTTSATASSSPFGFTQLGSSERFVFRANDGANGLELWVSDGTAAGTTLVKDINAGSASGSPNNMTAIGDLVWFAANDGTTGIEPWITDGTAAGTKALADILPGTGHGNPIYFAEVAGKVFFQATDPLAGAELFESDGTTAGTKLFRDFISGSGGSGRSANSLDKEAGQSEGRPSYMTPVGSRRLLFAVNTAADGNDLFQCDGTQAGTKLVADIAPSNNSSNPSAYGDGYTPRYTVAGSLVFFSADDGVHGQELWVLDNGATANPVLKGCGGSTMTGTDPIIGATFALGGKAAGTPLVSVCLLGAPLSSAPAFGVGCPILVDIGKAMIVLPATLGQAWSFPAIPVPNDKGLLGVLVRAQCWHLAAGFPVGTDLSNAVDLTIGN
ncbi:MAG: hypothetical protein R3F30_06780 [Planctomycetota bacterium]